MRVSAWRVQDTGLVAAPGPFRRLPGSSVRHLRGTDPIWPVRVVLDLDLDADDGLLVAVDAADESAVIGSWPRAEVRARRVTAGPPVQFVLELPGQAQLLAAAADAGTAELLAALAEPAAG